jgi:hypothetical protein
MSLGQVAVDFLIQPNQTNLELLRAQVRAADSHRWDVHPSEHGADLLQAGDATGAVRALEALLPGAFLNPGIHLLLAEAHRQLGDTSAVEREATVYQAALSAILGTGDGTETSPLSVLMIADEYDVLTALGKTSQQQSLKDIDGRRLDKHLCTDGTLLWFVPEWLS